MTDAIMALSAPSAPSWVPPALGKPGWCRQSSSPHSTLYLGDLLSFWLLCSPSLGCPGLWQAPISWAWRWLSL